MSRLNPNHPYFFTGQRVREVARWTWVAVKDLHAVEIDGSYLVTNNGPEMHQSGLESD